jgi:hypothetical protein
MCILGYIALEIGTSASLVETSERQMMQSWALGKPGSNLNNVFSAQQQKKCSKIAHDANFNAQAPGN